MSNNRPSSYEYYEIGLRSGDWMATLDSIEYNKKWAILYDRSEDHYEVYVNGDKVDHTFDFSEAEDTMQKYLRGQLRPRA